jgi:serine/threonine protein kinase
MGVVFKARQISLKRLVALKMMRAGPGIRPEALKRFGNEAEAVARLKHPNIVHIHEVGDKDGMPFFCLELVEGGSLGQRLAGSPLAPRAAAQLVQTLARAIHYAHQCGIVHRDLKPSNVLLAFSDDPSSMAGRQSGTEPQSAEDSLLAATPKITDFGLAKRLDSEAGGTRTGEIVGTPSYMAPEQASGGSKAVGPAADI